MAVVAVVLPVIGWLVVKWGIVDAVAIVGLTTVVVAVVDRFAAPTSRKLWPG